jgi:hypothetical protein
MRKDRKPLRLTVVTAARSREGTKTKVRLQMIV